MYGSVLTFSDSLSPLVPSLQVSVGACSGHLKELHVPDRLEHVPYRSHEFGDNKGEVKLSCERERVGPSLGLTFAFPHQR